MTKPSSPMATTMTMTTPSLHDDHADDPHAAVQDLVRRNRAVARQRLLDGIALLHRQINRPLADVVRDHVLHHLPAKSLLRFRAVSPSWALFVSSPIFAHTQSRTHRSISGVFSHSSSLYGDGPVAYSPFSPASAYSLPDPALSFLPASPVAVLSSSNGLLLCYDPSSLAFFICNPVTAAWAAVPHPPLDPGPDPAAVLIFSPGVYNFRPDYFVVIAFKIGGLASGTYGFQTFSSTVGDWWVSNELCMGERLKPSVSAGGVAYWRTSMSTVVGYEPATDRVRVVPWPMGYAVGTRWQIGEMGGGGRLYCVAVTEEAVQVHKLLGGSDEWALVTSVDVMMREQEPNLERHEEAWKVEEGGRVVFKKRPWPLRFQGGEMEILLWVAGRVVSVDLASKRVRVAANFHEREPHEGGAEYVPHISTFAPVPPSVTTTTS